MKVNPSIDPTDERQHLAEQHGLRETVAYVYIGQPDRKRVAAAKRQERRRQKLKSEGLVSVLLPADFAEDIKKHGSYQEWAMEHKVLSILEFLRLNQADEVAASYQSLPVWKQKLIDWIKRM